MWLKIVFLIGYLTFSSACTFLSLILTRDIILGEIKPGWGDDTKNRNFGFDEIKYRFNRGHWKFLDEVNGSMKAYTQEAKDSFQGIEERHFTTDFLFDRNIEFMERAIKNNKHFASVLSIPDPHGPNFVRSPYDDMYQYFNFSVPFSARSALRKDPGLPSWNHHDHPNISLNGADEYLDDYEKRHFYQEYMRSYFGMVKCIDDNVGKLFSYLQRVGIDNNTIIV